MSKLEIKLINFERALQSLKESVAVLNTTASDVIRDGVIQRFEFTFELAWKASKAYLEDSGIVDKNSPKAVIKEAYAQRMITDEQCWLLMMNDRNLTSHAYEEEMAKGIAQRIADCYVNAFEELLKELHK